MLTDEPLKANFRFGLLLETLDTIAEQTALAYVAQSHPEARFVTAAIDSIRIRNAPDVSRDMHLLARVNYVGRTSLEVGVRVEQAGDDGPHHLASCYATMVARSGPATTPKASSCRPCATRMSMSYGANAAPSTGERDPPFAKRGDRTADA